MWCNFAPEDARLTRLSAGSNLALPRSGCDLPEIMNGPASHEQVRSYRQWSNHRGSVAELYAPCAM